jgi:hypothetical protein
MTLYFITDTGSTMVYVPPSVAEAYWKEVPAADMKGGYYSFPCSETLPAFPFLIGGASFSVPGSYMKFQAVDDSLLCFGAIQPNTLSGGLNIYGVTLLKAVFVVFDSRGPQLGFASKTV